MERLQHLNPAQIRSIENWVEPLEPLKERYPILNKTDLIIEGGKGNGVTMSHVAVRLFPQALYVGTDISERLMGYNRSLRDIDPNKLERIINEHKYPSLNMSDATIYGNCFDNELVRDIAQKTNRNHPVLTSWNALNALTDRKLNPWEKKYEGDMSSVEEMVTATSPYMAQLHLVNYDELWDEDDVSDATYRNYCEMEEAAKTSGWITERLENGLLLINEHFQPQQETSADN